MYGNGCGLCSSKSYPGQHNIYRWSHILSAALILGHFCPSERVVQKNSRLKDEVCVLNIPISVYLLLKWRMGRELSTCLSPEP